MTIQADDKLNHVLFTIVGSNPVRNFGFFHVKKLTSLFLLKCLFMPEIRHGRALKVFLHLCPVFAVTQNPTNQNKRQIWCSKISNWRSQPSHTRSFTLHNKESGGGSRSYMSSDYNFYLYHRWMVWPDMKTESLFSFASVYQHDISPCLENTTPGLYQEDVPL